MKYCPLNITTCYTFLSSSLRIGDIFKIAKENDYDYFGVNDLNVMFSYSDILSSANQYKTKPIYGASFYVILSSEDVIKVSCYILNDQGFSNLCQIISNYPEGISIKTLESFKVGLIIVIPTTSNPFLIQLVEENKLHTISRDLYELTKGFEDAYIGIEIYSQSDNKNMAKIRDFANVHLYKTVAFNLHLYQKKNDAIVLSILQAIKEDLRLDKKEGEGPFFFLKESALKVLYSDNELINTINIAEACSNFELNKKRGKLLQYPINNKKEHILHICLSKLKELKIYTPDYINRVNYELNVIEEMGYLDYFLIVQDYVQYSKNNNIPVGPGRGSAAGSLISYLLNITEVDPMKYDLLFERFLNPKRSSMPDIDIDFADYKRNNVVSYIVNKYGKEKTANIITFQTFGPKAALKDIGKVFNFNPTDINLISKFVGKSNSFSDAYKYSNDFKKLCDDKHYLAIVKLAKLIEGLPRQQGMHPSGIIINNDNLSLSCPTITNDDGTKISQFEAPLLDTLGFLKMDLLGLSNITILESMTKYIKHYYNASFELSNIPLNDKKAFDALNNGFTSGLFQLESRGITNTLKSVKVNSFNDIVAVLALYRPGPMENIPVYADRKNNNSNIDYLHPSLKDILSSTYGVIVYQEQIMQIVQKIAGFDLARADTFRRAISKKDQSKLSSVKEDFLNGAINNNIEPNTANKIFDLILKFASYGYNKSHSVSYALITYQMAYIKANYPQAFYACIINHLGLQDERISLIKQELAYYKINIALPSIYKSKNSFVIEGNNLILPFTFIKGLNTDALKIIKEIQTKDISTFVKFIGEAFKLGLQEQHIILLINAGCLDCYGLTRTTLRHATPVYLSFYQNINNEGPLTRDELNDFLPIINFEPENEELKYELEVKCLNILLSGSILNSYQKHIVSKGLKSISEVLECKSTFNTNIVGIIDHIKLIKTKNNDDMGFITIKDDINKLKIVLFPKTYKNYSHLLKVGLCIAVKGHLENEKDLSFIANEIEILEENK